MYIIPSIISFFNAILLSAGVAPMLWTYIWEVLGSNPVRGTSYSNKTHNFLLAGKILG
jgi:hypothetical protein